MVVTDLSARPRKTMRQLTGSGAEPAPRLPPSVFSRGAIVSLRMVNFLVYKDVETVFGPRLNVVMGPNGSGKSTLVCAIALGLGGSPKLLGRADKLSSFVMHNVNEDASVTVELYVPGDEPNVVIRRTFSRKTNASIWHINGRSHTEKQVLAIIAGFGIQVENLCTFLPQDKVGSFSDMTPDKLLLETQKAMDFDQLYAPHAKLIDLQDSTGRKLNEEQSTATKLEAMETELASIAKDVKRMEERQQKQLELDLHKKKKVWVNVMDIQARGIEKRAEKNAARDELTEAKKADKPLQAEVHRWERENHRLGAIVNNRSKEREELHKAVKAVSAKIETWGIEVNKTQSQLGNIEKRRSNKVAKLAAEEACLVNCQQKLADLQERNNSLQGMEELTDAIERATNDVLVAKDDLRNQDMIFNTTRKNIHNIDGNIKRLTDQRAVRLRNFKAEHRQKADMALMAREWAEANGGLLRGPVSGPIALEVTVEDTEAASAMETHIAKHVWCALVVECKEDHDTILRAFSNKRGELNVQVNQGGMLKPQPAYFTKADMTRLAETAGVRGFLDDFYKCPDTIRQILRRSSSTHRVFLGGALTDHKIHADPAFLPSLSKVGKNGIPSSSMIFAGGAYGAEGGRAPPPLQSYQTKISLYGQRKPSTRVSEAREARVIGAGVDQDAVDEQEEEKAKLRVILEAADTKRKKVNGILRGLEGEEEKAKNIFSNYRAALKSEQNAQESVKRATRKIKNLKDELAMSGDVEKVEHINRLEKVFEQYALSVSLAQDKTSKMLDMFVEVVAATLARQGAADRLAMANEELCRAQTSRADLEDKVKMLERQTKDLLGEFTREAKKANTMAAKFVEGSDVHLTRFGEMFDYLPDNVAELDAVIDVLSDELVNTVDNPQVVHKHEKLKREVAEVQKVLDELKAANASSEEIIKAIRTTWLARLKAVIFKLDILFKAYMSDMDQCFGEIQLAEHDSYKKWALEIKVRFRAEKDGGRLSTLSGTVHSGGERSVATSLFLMALQDQQFSPFRVVDEINQGMDPKNERQVFSRIVKNSCGADRKQYFLITPKLLQGLVAMDNDDVTVHVVMNGPGAIAGKQKHSMDNFILAKKRQLQREAGEKAGRPAKTPRT